jgi:hypothetical protein
MSVGSPRGVSGRRLVPDELGWAWAAHLQLYVAGQWLVLWEPGSQHFTAFYLGDTAEGGAYRKAQTPQGLWERILAFDPWRPRLDLGGKDPDGISAWQLRIDERAELPTLALPVHTTKRTMAVASPTAQPRPSTTPRSEDSPR